MPPAQSNKVVLLVGAGFSTEYGPPVMRAFMGVARRNYFAIKDRPELTFLATAYELLLEFQQQCLRESGWIFNRDWENIEEVYTQADLLRLAKINPGIEAETLCRSIAWAIWDVYRKCPALTRDTPVNNQFRNVLKQIVNAGLAPVLITTNYDLFVEKSLTVFTLPQERPWVYYYPGFTWPKHGVGYLLPCTGAAIPPEPQALPIIKLHGSANWFEYESGRWVATLATGSKVGSITSVDDSTLGPDQLEDQIAAEIERVPLRDGVTADSYRKIIAPAIIPPMLGKASVAEVISSQWREAINVLGAARQIWIIGYSFPETDTFMPRLLSQGLQENQDLERIVVINIERREDWTQRISGLFTPTVGRTRVQYFRLPAMKALTVMGGSGGIPFWQDQLRQGRRNYEAELLHTFGES